MGKFKGTPGPWINVGGWVDAKKSGDLSSIICAIDSVASINPESVNDANANLIAAAPELLEALQKMFLAGQKQNWNERYESEMNAARAAIAKALGE